MPVADAVLQNPVKKRSPLAFVALPIVSHQLDHRILHQVQCFVTIADGNLGDPYCTALHASQKLIQLPFVLQRTGPC